jgi:hypothetical protein
MKKIYTLLFILMSFVGFSQNVTITKIIETGCSSGSGFVKTVELYVDGTVDFSTEVVLNYMQNGSPWAENQIDISAFGSISDSFIYIVRDIPAMALEFPGTTFDATNTLVVSTSTNGDDGYQVVLNDIVVSQFGKTETDADNDTDVPDWNHGDAVATRTTGVVDNGTWVRADWTITAENDLDANTACQNDGATNLETYFATLGGTFPLGSGSGWTAPLSVDQFNTNSFSIYPNPVADGFVNIRSDNAEILNVIAYDVLGKQVLSSTTLTNNQALNVSELKSGIYILQISQNNTSISKKLIIK